MKEQIEALIDLKAQRKKLDASIKAIEVGLADQFEVDLDSSKTFDIDGYKLAVKKPAYYKLDETIYDQIKRDIPPKMRAVKTKTELDKVGYKWLMKNEPAVFEIMAKAVTITPGKASIEIKE
jgi:hypothetical protein